AAALLAGLCITLTIALAAAVFTTQWDGHTTGPNTSPPRQACMESGRAVTESDMWSVEVYRARAAMDITSTHEHHQYRSARSACGSPDAVRVSDLSWPPPDGDPAPWIELEYDAPIVPAAVHIHETEFLRIVKVTLLDDQHQPRGSAEP